MKALIVSIVILLLSSVIVWFCFKRLNSEKGRWYHAAIGIAMLGGIISGIKNIIEITMEAIK
jgi:predicted permease